MQEKVGVLKYAALVRITFFDKERKPIDETQMNVIHSESNEGRTEVIWGCTLERTQTSYKIRWDESEQSYFARRDRRYKPRKVYVETLHGGYSPEEVDEICMRSGIDFTRLTLPPDRSF